MTKRAAAVLFGLCLLAGAAHAADAEKAAKSAPSPAAAPTIEPKAVEILKASSAALAAAKSMSFTAVVSYESPSAFGPPLLYTTKTSVLLQRPDKLRAITSADGPASEFYYDGKTMTAFEPAADLAATAKAPPTIDAALEAAYNDAAIYFPWSDLVVADPWEDVAKRLQIAFYIGQSEVVGGTRTDMVAWANDLVFVQAWIGADDKLPRRLRAVYAHDPKRMRHDMELSDWKLNGPVPDGAFESKQAASAKAIPFARPDLPKSGMKPPPAAAPAKKKK